MHVAILIVGWLAILIVTVFVGMVIYFMIHPDATIETGTITANTPVLGGSVEVIAPNKRRRVTGLK